MDNLIPEIPSTPVIKDSSDEDSEPFIQSAQGSPKKRPEKIRLEDATYKIVRRHINTLASIQSSLISLTEEIKRLDTLLEKESVPQHLLVRRSRPKLPSNLNHSEELKSAWDSQLNRAGRKLSIIWRQELARQFKRQRDRFREKEERAKTELENTIDSVQALRLFHKLLESNSKKSERKIHHRIQKADRRREHRRK